MGFEPRAGDFFGHKSALARSRTDCSSVGKR